MYLNALKIGYMMFGNNEPFASFSKKIQFVLNSKCIFIHLFLLSL